jgi:protein SCO1/2
MVSADPLSATQVTAGAGNHGSRPGDNGGMRIDSLRVVHGRRDGSGLRRPGRRPRCAGLVLVASVLGGALLAGCGGEEETLTGIVRSPLPQLADVSLPDAGADGEPFAFRAPEGGLLLLYFGYTYCPDVCPTTMADVRKTLREIDSDEAARVTVAMATVDPERDTADVITGYVQSFVEGAHGLRTEDDAELRAAADAIGASYDVQRNEEGEIEVAHTGYLYAIDDQGRLLVTWPFPTPQADLQADVELLLDQGADATGAV